MGERKDLWPVNNLALAVAKVAVEDLWETWPNLE